EHALVGADLVPAMVEDEVERQPFQERDQVRADVADAAEDRDDPARLVCLHQLGALGVPYVPVAPDERPPEVLLEEADQGAVCVEYLVAAAELEDGLRL